MGSIHGELGEVYMYETIKLNYTALLKGTACLYSCSRAKINRAIDCSLRFLILVLQGGIIIIIMHACIRELNTENNYRLTFCSCFSS